LLVTTGHIDDHNSLPEKVLVKTLFNCAKGVTDVAGRIARGDANKKVDFAYAHQLAKQIIR
jgi:hypothetical protein